MRWYLKGRTLGRWLGHEEKPFWMELVSLEKQSPEGPLSPSTKWRQSEKTSVSEMEVGIHQTSDLPASWSWTSQPPKINFFYLWATQSIVSWYRRKIGLEKCVKSRRWGSSQFVLEARNHSSRSDSQWYTHTYTQHSGIHQNLGSDH